MPNNPNEQGNDGIIVELKINWLCFIYLFPLDIWNSLSFIVSNSKEIYTCIQSFLQLSFDKNSFDNIFSIAPFAYEDILKLY